MEKTQEQARREILDLVAITAEPIISIIRNLTSRATAFRMRPVCTMKPRW